MAAHVYCQSRPDHADGPELPQYKELEDYIHSADIQALMQEMMTELLIAQPDEPVPFMIQFLEAQQTAGGVRVDAPQT